MTPTPTTWGYSFWNNDPVTLPDMMTVQEFDEYTAGKYAGDQRTAVDIKAACASIRNYVGWHLAPVMPCLALYNRQAGNVKRVGSDLLVQLPARFVPEVMGVLLNASYDADSETWSGDETTDFDFETNGILRIYDACTNGRKSKIAIAYMAGVPDNMLDAVKELIAHRVTHALAASYGVQTETAGGVSITYSANWINSARATALADDNKEILMPYRLQGVF